MKNICSITIVLFVVSVLILVFNCCYSVDKIDESSGENETTNYVKSIEIFPDELSNDNIGKPRSLSLKQIKKEIGSINENENQIDEQRISIVIMDSGVYPHEDIAKRIILSKDFVNNKILPYDDTGHGTSVAGIASYFNNADIISLKVLDHNNNTKIEDVIMAFRWILDNHQTYRIRVVNVSISLTTDKCDKELKELCNELKDAGIIVVASSGNEEDMKYYPAVYESVLAVGSIGITEQGACYISAFGISGIYQQNKNKPDILSFGERVITCDTCSLYKGNPEEKRKTIYSYHYESGTSFSCAVVTGIIGSLIEQMPGEDIDKVVSMLLSGKTIFDPYTRRNIPITVY